MKVYNVLFVLLVVQVYMNKDVSCQPSEGDSLRMILTLFRHGARSPVQSFPSDPHADYPWLNGPGELQPQGFEQLYQLGRNMRRRYKFFIPEDTATMKRSIYAVSSCAQRCIDSSQSFLTGFLKTSNGSEIRRQPVPIHVIPPDQDTYILQNKTCQKVKVISAQEKANSGSFLAALHREGVALQALISAEVGEPITSLYDTALICDNLEIYNGMGLKQPDWAYQIFPDRARAFLLGFLLSYSATAELKLIRGGAILSEYLRKMKAKRDGKLKQNRRMFFYSGHDLTQVNLFNALGMKEQIRRRPELGSAVVFELHKSKDFWKDLELLMFYYENSSIENPAELAIPNCAEPCSLTKFERTVKPLLLDDYDEICSTW
ncbi:testicular acid phosphatase homolog isoform X2 [Ochlerotatus camptorhynchus]|uniref:testicular acid phosphatase homolog isoform X2 n=1 Tax=Ochlerotatus camptorhynchus TaxID=644619 RepID=UPI0031DAAA5A